MKNTMFIPSKLNVGYQERNDTYSGKLAYVVYTDNKGVLRKEKSWRGWCKHFLPDTLNEPTEGFVLNRDVGGVRRSYGWDARLEKVRVYDPRGWEIEITIPNLLFILQECTSTKGKGLEGSFVYAWDGSNLVLLPTTAEEYISCVKYSNNQAKTVSKEDVKVGHWVKFKDDKDYIYLGRHKCREDVFGQAKGQHVYYNPDESECCQYRYESGFTKVAIVNDQDENYAQYLEDFVTGWRCNVIVDIDWVTTKVPVDNYRNTFARYLDQVYLCRINNNPNYSYYYKEYKLNAAHPSESVTNLKNYLAKNYHTKSFYVASNELTEWVKPVFILANGNRTEDGK
jgi:hypothetical protein